MKDPKASAEVAKFMYVLEAELETDLRNADAEEAVSLSVIEVHTPVQRGPDAAEEDEGG